MKSKGFSGKKNLIQEDVPMRPIVSKFGIIGGVLIILLGIFQSKLLGQNNSEELSFSAFLPMALIILGDIIYILLMILSVNTFKRLNNGIVYFKDAFLMTLQTGILIALISWISTLLSYFIYGGSGISGVTNNANSSFTQTLMESLPSFLANCVFVGIMALIISVVIKTKNPANLNT
jgi:hypothetical protein